MVTAFIGGNGAGGIFILIGLLILLLLGVLLFASGVTFACMKMPKSSVVSLCVALGIGAYLYSLYAEAAERAEWRANRKSNFDVAVQLSSPGGCAVVVDGVTKGDEDVLVSGTIRFHLDFGDGRVLSGRAKSFHSRHAGGEFLRFHLGGIEVKREDRAAFLGSFASAPQGADRSGWTEDYRVSFRKPRHQYETLECFPRKGM